MKNKINQISKVLKNSCVGLALVATLGCVSNLAASDLNEYNRISALKNVKAWQPQDVAKILELAQRGVTGGGHGGGGTGLVQADFDNFKGTMGQLEGKLGVRIFKAGTDITDIGTWDLVTKKVDVQKKLKEKANKEVATLKLELQAHKDWVAKYRLDITTPPKLGTDLHTFGKSVVDYHSKPFARTWKADESFLYLEQLHEAKEIIRSFTDFEDEAAEDAYKLWAIVNAENPQEVQDKLSTVGINITEMEFAEVQDALVTFAKSINGGKATVKEVDDAFNAIVLDEEVDAGVARNAKAMSDEVKRVKSLGVVTGEKVDEIEADLDGQGKIDTFVDTTFAYFKNYATADFAKTKGGGEIAESLRALIDRYGSSDPAELQELLVSDILSKEDKTGLKAIVTKLGINTNAADSFDVGVKHKTADVNAWIKTIKDHLLGLVVLPKVADLK